MHASGEDDAPGLPGGSPRGPVSSKAPASPGSAGSVQSRGQESGSLLGRTIEAMLAEREPAIAIRRLVSLQSELIRAASALLLAGEGESWKPAVSWKEGQETPVPPAWREQAEALAVEAARRRCSVTPGSRGTMPSTEGAGAAGTIEAGSEPRDRGTLIAQPLHDAAGGVASVAVFELPSRSAAAIALARERLELAGRCWAHWELAQGERSGAVGLALEILAGVAHEKGFAATAYGLCTRLAEALGAERVALATGRPGSLRLRGSSHALVFERGGGETRWLEHAMEICAGQDLELASPPMPGLPGVEGVGTDPTNETLERMRAERGAGPISMTPLRVRGRVVGVLLAEGTPLRAEDASVPGLVRLVAELCTPWLLERERADLRGLERCRAWLGETGRALVRPRGIARKLAFAGCALASLGLLVPVTYHVEAPFVVRARERRVVTAPFDGRLRAADFQPGDPVLAGQTVLATLDTDELELEWSRARSEYLQAQKRADAARTAGEPGDEQIAHFEGERARSTMQLVRTRIGQATILSPVSGVVLAGDLRKRIGSPVSRGDVLLEVAPLSLLEAEVAVPEDQLLSVEEGQRGWLVPAARPGVEVEVTVRRIDPLAEVTDQKNVFPVVAELRGDPGELGVALLPGMRGVARIEADPESLLWQWTREAIHYLRLHLWI